MPLAGGAGEASLLGGDFAGDFAWPEGALPRPAAGTGIAAGMDGDGIGAGMDGGGIGIAAGMGDGVGMDCVGIVGGAEIAGGGGMGGAGVIDGVVPSDGADPGDGAGLDDRARRGHGAGAGRGADLGRGTRGRRGAGARDAGGGERRAGPSPVDQRDPADVAREICLRQLAVRPRTRAELATALRRRGIADDVAASVLDRYDEVGLIDDAGFARAWVSSRHHGRGLARRALAGELRQRGIDSDTADEALEELDADTEAATARALVDRKLRGIGRATPESAFRRLVGMLARKGYAPDLAIRVVKDALAAYDDEAAEFAEQIDADALADAADTLDASGSDGGSGY